MSNSLSTLLTVSGPFKSSLKAQNTPELVVQAF